MLKTRIIPTLLYKDHGLVKGIRFDSWRRVGTALPAIKVYCLREVDELILVDISATREGRLVDVAEIDHLADECFMPLTVGGGVRSVEDCRRLLRAGADKVAINSSAVEHPDLIGEAAGAFGTQCVVLSMDVKRHADGRCEVFTRCGVQPTGRDPVAWALEAERLGAGEILLTSIDRDGTMNGYDVALTRAVSDAVSIPVIASGGAGSYAHMYEVVTGGHASAVAAASIFHFTQQTPLEAKRHLKEKGLAVRL
ncbi:MAG: imidazole glycerol phosphate synthase cyclase subunit [bacterium]